MQEKDSECFTSIECYAQGFTRTEQGSVPPPAFLFTLYFKTSPSCRVFFPFVIFLAQLRE